MTANDTNFFMRFLYLEYSKCNYLDSNWTLIAMITMVYVTTLKLSPTRAI